MKKYIKAYKTYGNIGVKVSVIQRDAFATRRVTLDDTFLDVFSIPFGRLLLLGKMILSQNITVVGPP